MVIDILKVDNGTAGKAPTVTFTVKDNGGQRDSDAQLTGLAEPSGAGHGGSDERLRLHEFRSRCDHGRLCLRRPGADGEMRHDGTCTYTFTHAIPADAKGTFSIGIEGRRGITLLAGTEQQMTTRVRRHEQGSQFLGGWFARGRAAQGGGHCQVQRLPLVPLAPWREPQPDRAVRALPQPERDRPARRAAATNPADKATPAQA